MEACSLFDVSSAVHTKSAKGVVSPMVVELYHLILAVELGEVNHETPVGLVKTAEVLARATEQLSCVARRLAEESKDEVFKQEVMPVAESLLISGKNILLVAQKLLIQHGTAACMKELALTAKKVLVETINLLRTEDSATIRRISQAACRLQGCLHKLESAENLSAMSVAFRSFSEAFLPLMGLTQNFLWDCRECLHWKHLAETFQVLKNCIPMLYTAKVNKLKYPSDQQVSLSKGYIFDLTRSTVKKLISLLSHGVGIQKLYERSGLFAQHLDKLLSLLSDSQPADLRDGKLDIFVETVVSCSLLLAESSRPPVKLKLIKLSHCLLKFRKLIVMDVSMMEESPAENHLEENTVEMCFALRAELENLKETVQTAVLYQVLDNFLEPEEPLQRLVAAAAAMEPSSPPEKGHFLRNLRPHITEFFNHSSQMLKAASFVLITCLDTKVIQDIESCVDSLSKCLAVVPTILSEMDHGPRNKAVERLSFLSRMWSSTIGSLLMCLDQAIELRAFLELSVQEMGQNKEESEKAFSNQQFRAFSWHAMCLSLQAIQVVGFVKRHVARTRDPVFRNGLLALVQQLEDCVPQLKCAADESLRMMLNPKAKAEYSKKARDLIEFACQVQKGLDECNQPDILSPLRDRVRNRSISKDRPCRFTPESSTETSEENDRKQNGSHNSKKPEESLARSSSIHCPSPRNLTGDITISAEATENHDMYPLIRELLSITKMYNISRVNSFCSDLLEISTCYVDAAKEVLPAAKSPVLEKLIHYREIVALMPHLLSLVRKVNQDPTSIMERLLQTAVLLSEKIEETKQCLILVASSWYSLARQLFCTGSPPDLPDNTQKINDIMAILRTIVQLVGKAVSVYHNREIPEFPRLHEAFLQVKAKFTCVQIRTKHLLEKGQAVSQLCSNQMQQECFDANCIMWSITIQAFLHSVDKFIGRDVLCLRELQTKVKQRLCLQSTLAAVSEGSLRIQEAIRLSFLSSTGNSAKNEIMALKEQMKTLTDALLRVADILSTSPMPAPNLSVRFELLQRELAVTATVLLLQLGAVNREYLNTIQDIISPSQPMLPDSESCSDIVNQKAAASRLLVNVQKVKKIIGNAMESPCFLKLKESLFSTVDHLLVLTDEVMERAEKLQNQPEEELFLVDSILYEWSTVAMYLVGQLQSTEEISAKDLECVKQCLQNHEEHAHSDQLFCKSQALVGAEDQNLLIQEHKETHKNMQPQENPQGELQPKTSEQDLNANSAASLAGSETWWHHSWSVAQVTKQMATQVSYMAQFLKRKGPITTKEQLIACATEIITGGETLIRFAGIIAKNCQDERCAAELVHIMEQAKMVSYQLSIISRVNASTGKSRSSTEHVVSNAQNLIRMVIQMLKAAEAACIKNLQPSFSNTEEADVAAFCSQWKKSLWWHRVKEALNSDRDELGLRKTGSWSEPTFTAMIQNVSV